VAYVDPEFHVWSLLSPCATTAARCASDPE